MIKVFTSFSGYDSQCLALRRLNIDFDLVGWSEIDRFAIQAHNALFPEFAGRNFGDIAKIEWQAVPDFDLFTYSSPCQDFSAAGRQAGGEKDSGTRSSLLWECEKAISIKRPKICLMENVAALVSRKFIKLFNRWQRTLEGYGYKNFARVLNAKDYGVPQNRERIFLVSILDGGHLYFPEPEKLQRRLKDVLEINVDEKYYLSRTTIEMFDAHKEKNAQKGNGFGWNPTDGSGVATTIETSANTRPADNFIIEKPTATTFVAGSLQAHAAKADLSDASAACPTIGTTDLGLPKLICCGKLDYNNDQINRIYNPEGLAPAQLCRDGGNTQTKIIEPTPQVLTLRRTEYGKEIRKEYESGKIKTERKNVQQLEPRTDGISNTLTSVEKDNLVCEPIIAASRGRQCEPISKPATVIIDQATKSGHIECKVGGVFDAFYPTSKTRRGRVQDGGETAPTLMANNTQQICHITNAYRIRKLTPRECFRLMGLLDEEIDTIQAAKISNTQQYKMAGNSIVVNVLCALFRKMYIDTKNDNKQLQLF